MRIAIIGRSELLYKTALLLNKHGYEIALVVTAKEAPEYKITSKDYENLARELNALFIKTAKINEPEIIKKIEGLGPIDLAVSINYSGIIAQSVIDLFPLGVLNAHGGDLPKYRGNACQAWAIINGEKKIGLCVHKMIGGELDSGDILSREYYDLNIDTRIGEVYEWMENRIPYLMLDSIKNLENDSGYFVEQQSKDPKLALRCYPRNPGDGKIDWRSDSLTILRLINASSEPFAGAFCFIDSEKIHIWRACLYEDGEVYIAVPGQVCKIESDGSIVVITGKGKLKLIEVSADSDLHRIKPSTIINSIRKRLE